MGPLGGAGPRGTRVPPSRCRGGQDRPERVVTPWSHWGLEGRQGVLPAATAGAVNEGGEGGIDGDVEDLLSPIGSNVRERL
jgi:hypothetical protein